MEVEETRLEDGFIHFAAVYTHFFALNFSFFNDNYRFELLDCIDEANIVPLRRIRETKVKKTIWTRGDKSWDKGGSDWTRRKSTKATPGYQDSSLTHAL